MHLHDLSLTDESYYKVLSKTEMQPKTDFTVVVDKVLVMIHYIKEKASRSSACKLPEAFFWLFRDKEPPARLVG